tara:strand:+ start:63 stop:227 length:165 start_codon:yes stop_codon:yes gene_type:complete
MEITQHFQHPAGIIFNNTIPVVVGKFRQWAMELGAWIPATSTPARYHELIPLIT